MKITPFSGALGAEIDGVDLSQPMGAGLLREIEEALSAHLVLFFHDQSLTPERQLRMSAQFGNLMRIPYVEPLADYPELIAVLKEPDEKRISTFGSEWHSDFSFLVRPPALSFLYAVQTPSCGGDTVWANMCSAYETLSIGFRRLLDSLDKKAEIRVHIRKRMAL